ncbi:MULTISPECIES: hypothetical protein [Paenibacillus]|uniref:Uncharacterized protein n=1 Tax=Paenibacillus campinasensis TaxID=66347 RepID=A0ABW9T2Y0_9BACL|nr:MULTISPECIES: hypothetical protein [Paenibacillus]MUG67078.1 hypothetical protein [Paenibacillus campinasensis]PAK55032.1 hypothetical protein CHH75_05800 [Paenibacillus sp. 7541]
MARDTDKRGMVWFKNALSKPEKQDEVIQEGVAAEETQAEPALSAESGHTPDEGGNGVFSKDHQDKISLDVIVSIENILKDRQLLTYKNKGLEEQLAAANEAISRYKHEQIKKDQLIQEKSKEIRELENVLTNKQMSYDQLLEDYKEYQLTSNLAYEKLSSQLETEIAKYNKLQEETTNTQYQNMLKINALEDKIRALEIENQKYAEQYRNIVDEKAKLMQTITDFTEKMSFSFTPKGATSPKSSDE